MVIKYESKHNGYSGVLYGSGSMSIYDPQGHEVLHTLQRAGHTLEYLEEVVDTADRLVEMLRKPEEADDERDD